MFSVAPKTCHCLEIHIRNSSLSVFFFSHFSFQLSSLLCNKPAPDLLLKIHTKDWEVLAVSAWNPEFRSHVKARHKQHAPVTPILSIQRQVNSTELTWLAWLASQQAPDPVWDSVSNKHTTKTRWGMIEEATSCPFLASSSTQIYIQLHRWVHMPRTTMTTKVTLWIWKLTVLSSAALVWALSYYSWHRWFDPDGLTPCPTIGARCQASPSLWSFLLQEAHTIFFWWDRCRATRGEG